MDELVAALIGVLVAVIAYVLMRGVRTWWSSQKRDAESKSKRKPR